MTRVGIVGGGVAAAGVAYALDRSAPEVSVTVLEASGELGGRAATRRRGEVTYDYGANYVKSADPRVSELLTGTLEDGLVDVTDPVWTFDHGGTVSPGRDSDDHKWTYRDGIAGLVRRLLARTDAVVHRNARVEGVARAGGSRIEALSREAGDWHLTDAGGREWGPFDAVASTPPAPETAALLRDADWESEARDRLREAAAGVDYRAVWTAVLGYSVGIDRPYYALVNADKDHAVGWISREECKPGHVPDGETVLVVQAGGEWSTDHAGDPPAENVATLAAHAADVLGDERLAAPDWNDHHAWRHALAESGVDRAAVAAAEAEGWFPAGDWVAGEARVHAALREGLDAGDRIAARCS